MLNADVFDKASGDSCCRKILLADTDSIV